LTIGIGIRTANKLVFSIGIGYEMQKMNFIVVDYYGYYLEYLPQKNSGAFTIDAGISF
jgi:hypothetical protein